MKKFISLILTSFLCLSILLSGCGKKDGQDSNITNKADLSSEQNNNDEKITLRMMWWGSQDRHDRTLKVIELFESQNPNITIEPEFSGWSGYWEKIAAQTAANTLPDIFQQDYAYLTQYATKGLLEDLYPYVTDKRMDLSDVSVNNYIGGEVDKGLYGINIGTNAMCVVYNTEVFKEAGIEEPNPEWTWDDYEDAGRTINEKLGIYGLGNLPGGNFHGFKHYLRQHGEVFYAPDGKSLGFSDEKYYIEFFGKELKMVQDGIIAPPDVRMEIKSPEQELVVHRKSAISDFWSNQIIAAQSVTEDKLKLALIPKAKDQVQEGLYLKPGQFLSVAKSSQQKDAAVSFINFFTNDIEANKILFAERGVPISSKVREALKPLLVDSQREMFDYIDLVIEHSSPIDSADPSGHPEVTKLLENLQEQILFEQITVEDAAKQFMKEANAILSK